jgi:V/A-type H+-transporting ATPase subunit G/H
MGIESVLSIGERLQRLLVDAEKEAEERVEKAKRKAEEMILEAKAEAERRRTMAQRGTGIDELIEDAEEKARKEAENKMEEYKVKSEALKNVPYEKIDEAVALVLKEVLPE